MNPNPKSYQATVGGRTITVETGKLAGQADGAVTVKYGDTIVLATACVSSEKREGIDFIPLTVEYEEKHYAVGKIPGSFIRRESRPSQDAILADRLVDRSLRPLLTKGFRNEMQVVITVLSSDQEMVVWCLSRLEVLSALCRQLREEVINESVFDAAKGRLTSIFQRAYEITALDKVRSRAARLLEVHPLRAADACQLAAALVATGEDPSRLELICFDKRLAIAARREGFDVNPTRGQ